MGIPDGDPLNLLRRAGEEKVFLLFSCDRIREIQEMSALSEPRSLKFDIIHDHQLPGPRNEDDEQRLFLVALDQVEFADRLGFDTVWEVDLHFRRSILLLRLSKLFWPPDCPVAFNRRSQSVVAGFQ